MDSVEWDLKDLFENGRRECFAGWAGGGKGAVLRQDHHVVGVSGREGKVVQDDDDGAGECCVELHGKLVTAREVGLRSQEFHEVGDVPWVLGGDGFVGENDLRGGLAVRLCSPTT